MTSALTVLTAEPIELFNTYRDSCLKRFQPADEFEISLVDHLVAAGWRIARIWAMEKKALDREMAAETRENDPDETLFDAFNKLSERRRKLQRRRIRDPSRAARVSKRYSFRPYFLSVFISVHRRLKF